MGLNNTTVDLDNNIINQLKNFEQKFKIIQKEYITPDEMNIIDNNCEYYGLSKHILMENAGIQVYNEIINWEKQDKNTSYDEIYLFCGKGNNGGDGFVLARHLSKLYKVNVVILNNENEIKTSESKANFEFIKNIYKFGNINIQNIQNISNNQKALFQEITYKLDNLIKTHNTNHNNIKNSNTNNNNNNNNNTNNKKILFVDALLGTGISGNLKYPYDLCVEYINSIKNNVNYNKNVDIISIDAETKGLTADKIIAFHKYKKSLNNPKKTVLKEIGIPKYMNYLIGKGELKALSKIEEESHKGNNGRTLVIGGSKDYYGAPIFSALAASKVVDIMTVATVSPVVPAVKNYPELMIKEFGGDYFNKHHVEELAHISKNYDSIVLGCGMGLKSETREFLQKYLNKILSNTDSENFPTLIIDADAIKLLNPKDFESYDSNNFNNANGTNNIHNVIDNSNKELLLKLFTNEKVILTPHKGEFEYIKPILEDLSEIYKLNIVLKGKTDIVFNKNNIKLNMTGNAGMTVGGTGDILAGLIAGFATKNEPYLSACSGIFVNGLAGDYLYDKIGYNYNSKDIIKILPKILYKYII
ncbi:bifunctional ADP-dependent NAD(P)H-hydrate dehydratase/NAD(P)H-hydrate epimerase [Methanococcus voltae]|uniref:ADP-dependent (S)-NAD(P)H-hydrate dehydratase n=1 Tax=Methanococcus voltae (strain ATCC BAA-1334 / A3) TaxID=456320 RepID=D7DUP0_METV3|nr:bifunctional ADP-dependent NAD(P)H-hydrate dehydratase/NAD(P)H-hydrate epimerase [Methanococcus voltae]MCS3900652.1 NAD(P)H-hydrate epimerase [Methanococcus voltae]